MIDRGPGPLKLTAAGASFALGGPALLDNAWTLAHTASRASKGLTGALHIAYTDFAMAGSLPGIVNAFRVRFPDVGIAFTPMVTTEQVAALQDGRVDVGLLTGPVQHAALRTHRVQEDEIVVAIPERHRLARGPRPTVADLAGEPFVMGASERWSQFLGHVGRICQEAGFLPRMVQEAVDSEAILSLVAAGIGITLNVESVASRPRRGVRVRRLAGPRQTVPTLLAWRSETDNPIVNHFYNVAVHRIFRASRTS